MTRLHVHGVGVAGAAVVATMARRGAQISVSDDASTPEARVALEELADRWGIDIVPTQRVEAHLAGIEMFVPAPGVAETHPLIAAAQAHGCEVVSEIEIAYRLEQERPGGARPLLSVTGTDGKTTTCLLATAMLSAAGVNALAVGNTETPLIAAIDAGDHTDRSGSTPEVFVVECSSFRLAWTHRFRSTAAAWLNLSPDHLNWHRSMQSYEAAKARIFSLLAPEDLAVGYADDSVVMRHLGQTRARRVRVGAGTGSQQAGVEYWSNGAELLGPQGSIMAVGEMWRSLPHDQTNVLAAAALVMESGLADAAAVARAVSEFPGVPHRIEPIATSGDVQWFNDSKATTPHAALAAINGFASVVLIAGGLNKGLDLRVLAGTGRVTAVVAIGQAAGEIAEIFRDQCPVVTADSMASAVAAAAELSRPGDAVLLSPGCASFDWYPSGGYMARGDDFRACVQALLGASPAGALHDADRQNAPVDAGLCKE